MLDSRDVLTSPYFIRPGGHDPYTKADLRQIDLGHLFSSGLRHAWIGASPPFGCHHFNLDKSTGFRCSSFLHQSFDVVWCSEHGVLRQDNWSLLIDEAIRLIGGRGFLVLRIPLPLPELVGIKRFLARRFNFSCHVIDEVNTGHDLLTVLQVERLALEPYRSTAWTVGILASGKRNAVVEEMIATIRQSPGGADHEIIIFGPENPAFHPYDVKWLRPDDYGVGEHIHSISKKKNTIARVANHENLVICHDRYVIDKNFFSGFARYGYDFDFVTVPQYFDDGQPFPSLGSVGGMDFNKLTYTTTPSRHLPTPYVNGGFFVIKKSLMTKIPMNEHCFWNQGEDVEYAETLTQNGVVPRLNVLTRAITKGVAKSHCHSFLDPDNGRSILLNFHRKSLGSEIQYYWALNGYDVGQTTSMLDDTLDARLVMSTSEGDQVSVTIELSADTSDAKLYCSFNSGRWVEVLDAISTTPEAPTTVSAILEVVNQQADILFRIVPDGDTPDGLPHAGTGPSPKPRVKVSSTVRKVSRVRQPIIDFTSGFYGLENDGSDAWTWASEHAEITLLNPNPFPVSATLTFDYWHILPTGETALYASDTQIKLLTLAGGDHVAKKTVHLPLHLIPGATRLTLRSVGGKLNRCAITNDHRELSISINNYSIAATVPNAIYSPVLATGKMVPCTSPLMAQILRSDTVVDIGGLLPLSPNTSFYFPLRNADRTDMVLCADISLAGKHKQPVFGYFTANGWNIGRVRLKPDIQTHRLPLPSWIFDNTDVLEIRYRAEGDGKPPVLAGIGVFKADTIDRTLILPPLLRSGTRADFMAEADGLALLGTGWHPPESSGTWSSRNGAELFLAVATREGSGLCLSIEACGLFPTGAASALTVTLEINGIHRERLTFSALGFQTFKIDVPSEAVRHGTLALTFFQDNIRSPKEIGISEDRRPLGIMLKSIGIDCA